MGVAEAGREERPVQVLHAGPLRVPVELLGRRHEAGVEEAAPERGAVAVEHAERDPLPQRRSRRRRSGARSRSRGTSRARPRTGSCPGAGSPLKTAWWNTVWNAAQNRVRPARSRTSCGARAANASRVSPSTSSLVRTRRVGSLGDDLGHPDVVALAPQVGEQALVRGLAHVVALLERPRRQLADHVAGVERGAQAGQPAQPPDGLDVGRDRVLDARVLDLDRDPAGGGAARRGPGRSTPRRTARGRSRRRRGRPARPARPRSRPRRRPRSSRSSAPGAGPGPAGPRAASRPAGSSRAGRPS